MNFEPNIEMYLRHIDHIIKVEIPQAYQKKKYGIVRTLSFELNEYILGLEKMGYDILTDVEKEGFILDVDIKELPDLEAVQK